MMRSVGKVYCGFSCVCSYLKSPLLLLFRLVWGYMFIMAGWHKFAVQGIPATAEFFSSLGISFPYFNAVLVASFEMLGGIFLIVGFLSRLIAIPLIIILVTAYMTAHHEAVATFWQNPDLFFQQPPWNFLVATTLVLVFGPGVFSIDYLWKRCSTKDQNQCCSTKDACCPIKDHHEEK